MHFAVRALQEHREIVQTLRIAQPDLAAAVREHPDFAFAAQRALLGRRDRRGRGLRAESVTCSSGEEWRTDLRVALGRDP